MNLAIETPRLFAKRKVKARIKAGWHAWVSPARSTVWARFRKDDPDKLDTDEISAAELDVLDEVLLEAM